MLKTNPDQEHSRKNDAISTVVELNGGFGNRLNKILQYLDTDYKFLWPLNEHCQVKLSDLFENDDSRMIYSELDVPLESEVIEYDWQFYGEITERVTNFIKDLNPVESIKRKILNLPDNTQGYYIRSMHPESLVETLIDIPDDAFLVTDSKQQREFSKNCIQIEGKNYLIEDLEGRDLEHYQSVIADWMTLFQCEVIHEYGLPFYALDDVYSHHSTFIDAHRVLGMNIKNYHGNARVERLRHKILRQLDKNPDKVINKIKSKNPKWRFLDKKQKIKAIKKNIRALILKKGFAEIE